MFVTLRGSHIRWLAFALGTPTSDNTGKKIDTVDSFKFLGVILEFTITWGKHIDLITSKVNSLTYMIRFLRPVLSLKIIKQIYSSYVHSILTYNIIFWGNSR